MSEINNEKEIGKVLSEIEKRLEKIEENQKRLDTMLNHLQRAVLDIESDIYEDELDDLLNFEVVCPYCNAEFEANLDEEDLEENEITCPECNNTIELDFSDDDEGCSGHCGHCNGCE